ncbi:MAG: hypothetical protein JNJ77_02240 [Planctomycetia bacterium]|nr:hypothetical protein [Planctomycetia bacterium]
MFARNLSLILAFCSTSAACAQYGYGGLIRMDYGDLSELERIVRQADARLENTIQQMMRMPEIQKRYQEFRQAGGTLAYKPYVHWLAQTAGGTPEGINRFLKSERNRIEREKSAYADLSKAHRDASESMQRGFDNAMTRNREFGDVIAGNQHYLLPNGSQVQLPYTRPGFTADSAGRTFYLDQYGNYSYLNEYGYWVPLRPKN